MEYLITLKGSVRPISHTKSLEDAMCFIIKNKLLILSYTEFSYFSIIFTEYVENA